MILTYPILAAGWKRPVGLVEGVEQVEALDGRSVMLL